ATWNPLADNTSFQATATTGVYTGVNTSVLTITRVPSTMDQYLYDVVVTDRNGLSTTSGAALMGVGPNISLDDQPKSGCPTANVTLTSPVVPGVSYQWQVSSNNGTSWTNISDGTDPSTAVYSGSTANNLTISNLPVSFNNNLYRYQANNGLGCNVISGNITLSVPALAVVINPGNAVVDASNNAVFTVSVSGGSAPYSYRWTVSTNGGISYTNLSDNATYSGSATNTLSITGVTPTMFNYLYRPIVRNSGLCATANINFAKLVTNIALPLKLESFTAQKQGSSSVKLLWTIDALYPARSYTVQRSTDGLSFTDLAIVKGEAGKTSYSLTDDKPGSGVTQYRIKMTDQDGVATYSTTITVNNDEITNRIELRPSITENGSTSLYTALVQNEVIILTITDVAGRQQWSGSASLGKGACYTPLDVSHLSNGLYYVRITSKDGISKTLPLVKR
ncbi:MAG: T9SS type A sorting domain-containing protein, partial [Bacteroidota bacterium]